MFLHQLLLEDERFDIYTKVHLPVEGLNADAHEDVAIFISSIGALEYKLILTFFDTQISYAAWFMFIKASKIILIYCYFF